MLCFHSPSVASGSEAEGVKPKRCVSEIKRKENPFRLEGGAVSSHTNELISVL